MEKVLRQEDIDALFGGAQMAANPAAANVQSADESVPYSFNNAGQISNDQMRSITIVNDLFARNLMDTVGAWLRTDFQITLVSGEQMQYAEFVSRIPEQSYLCSVRMEPLGAIGILELDLLLAAPIVDLLLGGTGKAQKPRPLTDIEELIMASLTDMMVKELNSAWHEVGLQFSFDKREQTAHIGRVLPQGEKILCVCFEVRMPGSQGVLNLCLPAVVLNTTLRSLAGRTERPRRRSQDVRLRMRELLAEAKVGAVLQFPPVRLRATELAALAPGSVLRLPVPRHSVAELRVAGLALSRARPVRMGEHRGARLESMFKSSQADLAEASQEAQ